MAPGLIYTNSKQWCEFTEFSEPVCPSNYSVQLKCVCVQSSRPNRSGSIHCHFQISFSNSKQHLHSNRPSIAIPLHIISSDLYLSVTHTHTRTHTHITICFDFASCCSFDQLLQADHSGAMAGPTSLDSKDRMPCFAFHSHPAHLGPRVSRIRRLPRTKAATCLW